MSTLKIPPTNTRGTITHAAKTPRGTSLLRIFLIGLVATDKSIPTKKPNT